MFKETKYGIVYIKIIEKAKTENRAKLKKNNPKYIYYEEHHIIPKSIDKTLIEEKTNLVLLTAREHFICHLLIWKHYKKLHNIINERKMSKAIRKLNNNGKYSSKIYSNYKLNLSHSKEAKEKMSLTRKKLFDENKIDNSGENNPMFGKLSIFKDNEFMYIKKEELKKYLSDGWIKKGLSKTSETRNKIAESRKGTKLSEETKQKISITNKGRISGMKGKHHTDITKDKLSENSKNRIWISNNIINKTKFIKENEVNSFINSGWIIGRIKF